MRAGRVRINGRVARLGDVARADDDRVELDGRRIRSAPLVYWIAHKPVGTITTRRDPEGRPRIVELLPLSLREQLFPVGRLDLATEGLVLLTNDGATAHALLHPSLGSEREYRITARGELSAAAAARLARGVKLSDGRTAAAEVGPRRHDARSDTTVFHLTLREGRKRQIRRSLGALGHPVRRLLRVRMGPLRLGRLAPGRARPLTRAEVRALRAHVERVHRAREDGEPGVRSLPRKPRKARRESSSRARVKPRSLRQHD